ncbi:MAG: DNA replication/repair protein RecF [Oscillospiraceae bacterium]|jgi:DNA replication and repair protein RecF|nr:DNA replication/repair protein RecF [Oscillospiraceae bacterium]
MIVNELFLDGFRNYSGLSAQFCDGVNVIAGQNAQGKTNLIEAIYYLAVGRSFRPASDKELISFDCNEASIRAGIVSGDREQVLEARIIRGRHRQLYANDVKLKKISELTGRLTVVLFCPDDLNLIKDGASVRRKMMDSSLSQLRPGYIAALSEFNRLYENKTRILRDYHEKPALLELLDDFDLRLAEQSARLIYYRAGFAKGLSRRAASIHEEFSGGKEEMTIKYKTVGRMEPDGMKPSEILSEVLKHQSQHRSAELRSGLCLTGAHKDDLEIEISGVPARKYASQGQARTASVSIKLAERDIHYDDRNEYPVLLLDDVLSELDLNRQNFILDKIKHGQVFITCCDDTVVSENHSGKTLRIENGRLV